MKLFIISDLHGSLKAFQKALMAYKKEKASLMIICGDYLNHGPRNDIPLGYEPKALASALNEMKTEIVGVRGNCDSEVDQMMLEFPVQAPYTNIVLPFEKKPQRIFIHHGHLYDEKEIAEKNYSGTIIVSGHTHIPVLEEKEYCGRKYFFFNPGSISIPKGDSVPSYGIIDVAINATYKKIEMKLCSLEGVVIKTMITQAE